MELFTAEDMGRRRQWSDEDKVRIVEESFRGQRQGSATARRHGISRSLLSIWRRAYREGTLGGLVPGGGFVPLVIGGPRWPRWGTRRRHRRMPGSTSRWRTGGA